MGEANRRVHAANKGRRCGAGEVAPKEACAPPCPATCRPRPPPSLPALHMPRLFTPPPPAVASSTAAAPPARAASHVTQVPGGVHWASPPCTAALARPPARRPWSSGR